MALVDLLCLFPEPWVIDVHKKGEERSRNSFGKRLFSPCFHRERMTIPLQFINERNSCHYITMDNRNIHHIAGNRIYLAISVRKLPMRRSTTLPCVRRGRVATPYL